MQIYRQGDVMLICVKSAARGKDVRENGRIILAHGEVTGHAHEVVSERGGPSTVHSPDERRRAEEVADAVVNLWSTRWGIGEEGDSLHLSRRMREGLKNAITQAFAFHGGRVERLEAALRRVLASASPHPTEHPAMFVAWQEARAALDGKETT